MDGGPSGGNAAAAPWRSAAADEGANALALALKDNPALQNLYLANKGISDAVKQQIKTDTKKTRALTI